MLPPGSMEKLRSELNRFADQLDESHFTALSMGIGLGKWKHVDDGTRQVVKKQLSDPISFSGSPQLEHRTKHDVNVIGLGDGTKGGHLVLAGKVGMQDRPKPGALMGDAYLGRQMKSFQQGALKSTTVQAKRTDKDPLQELDFSDEQEFDEESWDLEKLRAYEQRRLTRVFSFFWFFKNICDALFVAASIGLVSAGIYATEKGWNFELYVEFLNELGLSALTLFYFGGYTIYAVTSKLLRLRTIGDFFGKKIFMPKALSRTGKLVSKP